jgi:hypothetical protein
MSDKVSRSKSRSTGKRSRALQLAAARKCRKIESSGRNIRDNVDDSQPALEVRGPSTSKAAIDVELVSSPANTILGERTRTQFKIDSSYHVLDSSQDKSDKLIGLSVPVSTSCKQTRAIVDLQELDTLIQALCCSLCKNESLCLRTVDKRNKGLAVYVEVFCTSCEEIVCAKYLATQVEEGRGERPFIINKQAVFSSLVCGLGSNTFNNLCESLDLQGMTGNTFHKKAHQLYKELPDLHENVFGKTAQYVRQIHAKHFPDCVSKDGIIDISVSYDGTWLTRGHTSHIGVGCVVDLLTGLCIDAHVMSTYCHICETRGKSVHSNTPLLYSSWYEKHLPECDKNFNGSSGMMEVEAAKVLWNRSVDSYKLRYTTILSDGDSKTFNELNSTRPYGKEVEIDKEECTNHVSKRLGTALRNMVVDCGKKGITLGGKARGQLTQAAIRRLTIYYNRAIRGNKTVDSMKKAIYATVYHCFSTDDNPRHEMCPTGSNSWCFYQSSVANHKFPGPHIKFVHTPLNYSKLSPHMFPIYERLSDDRLLQRCVSGNTQNANECLHSLIWSRCSKENFASRKRVQFAVTVAAGEFNFGSGSSQNIARFYGFNAGANMTRLGNVRLQKRLRNSLKCERDRKIKRREAVRTAKLKRQEELLLQEGGMAYAAGKY